MNTETLLSEEKFVNPWKVEKYLCLLYGEKKCDSINYVRLQMYMEKLKQFSRKGSENEIILKIKKLDCSS